MLLVFVLVLSPALVSRLDSLVAVGFAAFVQLYDIGVQECRIMKSQRKSIHLLFLSSRLVSDLLWLVKKNEKKWGKGCQTWSHLAVPGISRYQSALVLTL